MIQPQQPPGSNKLFIMFVIFVVIALIIGVPIYLLYGDGGNDLKPVVDLPAATPKYIPGAKIKIDGDESKTIHYKGDLKYGAGHGSIMNSAIKDDALVEIDTYIKPTDDIKYLAIAVDDELVGVETFDGVVNTLTKPTGEVPSVDNTPHDNYAMVKNSGYRWNVVTFTSPLIKGVYNHIKIKLREDKDVMSFEIRYGEDLEKINDWKVVDSKMIYIMDKDVPTTEFTGHDNMLIDWKKNNYGYWSTDSNKWNEFIKDEKVELSVDMANKPQIPAYFVYNYDSNQMRDPILPGGTYEITLTCSTKFPIFIRPYICTNEERKAGEKHVIGPDTSDDGKELIYKPTKGGDEEETHVWIFTQADDFIPCSNLSFVFKRKYGTYSSNKTIFGGGDVSEGTRNGSYVYTADATKNGKDYLTRPLENSSMVISNISIRRRV